MEALQEKILKEGKVLPNAIIKVDGFLNHRVDTQFVKQIADEFARRFDLSRVTLVATVEASGNALAGICAYVWGLPMLFAKKAKSDNIVGDLYQCEITSYTYNKKATLTVAKQWLGANERVLVIDDFLAHGEAVGGLCKIIAEAGAELVGVGCVVEKGFQDGGKKLRERGIKVESLAIIEKAEPGNIVFRK